MQKKPKFPFVTFKDQVFDIIFHNGYLSAITPKDYTMYEMIGEKLVKVNHVTYAEKIESHGLFFNEPMRMISNITRPGNGNFIGPTKMDGPTKNIYNLKTSENYMEILSFEGKFIGAFGKKGTEGESMQLPSDFCINEKTREIFIVDKFNNRINVYTMFGKYLGSFGKSGNKSSEFILPSGITINPHKKEIVVADTGNQRIQFFDYKGKFLRFCNFSSEKEPIIWPTRISYDISTKKYAIYMEPIQMVVIFG